MKLLTIELSSAGCSENKRCKCVCVWRRESLFSTQTIVLKWIASARSMRAYEWKRKNTRSANATYTPNGHRNWLNWSPYCDVWEREMDTYRCCHHFWLLRQPLLLLQRLASMWLLVRLLTIHSLRLPRRQLQLRHHQICHFRRPPFLRHRQPLERQHLRPLSLLLRLLCKMRKKGKREKRN